MQLSWRKDPHHILWPGIAVVDKSHHAMDVRTPAYVPYDTITEPNICRHLIFRSSHRNLIVFSCTGARPNGGVAEDHCRPATRRSRSSRDRPHRRRPQDERAYPQHRTGCASYRSLPSNSAVQEYRIHIAVYLIAFYLQTHAHLANHR